MKKINFLLLFVFIANYSIFAQTVIWTEAFQNNCSAGCFATAYTGPNGTWTQTATGTNGAEANAWFISGNECGNAAGACGSVCGTADPSLHIGANDGFTTVDPGASYNAGGLCGLLFCVATDRRIESPTINLTGQSNITLNFNYMENGQTTIDNATLWYFDGTTWSQLFDLAKTVLCGLQGTWTAYSQLLPASANNNPNVKIGFRWVNNDDGVGTDPSFAVDDITLTVPTATGPTANFTTSATTVCVGGSITFTNTSTTSGATTYAWVFPGGTPGTANTAGPHAVTFNTAGTQNISLTVTDVNGTDNVVIPITVVAPPTTSVAGPPQTVCATTATLAGNAPTVGTGTWTLVSGAGTITTPSSPTSGVTGLGVGANVFQWSIANAPCTPSTSTVTITAIAPPTTSVAGTPQTVCATTATLAGNTPTVGTGIWTLVSGAGTITTPSSPTSSVTGLGVGANVFQWSIANAPCTPSTSTVTITGIAPQVANAGPNQATCNTSVTLAGNAPTAGTGTWTLISGTGIITTPSSPTSGVTGLGLGANVFEWTITNPPCTPSTSTVTITVNNCSQPTASFNASSLSVCQGDTIIFTDNSTGSGISAWSWTFPTGSPATANTQGPHTVIFNTAGTHNINLQITDANGIDDTTIVITVIPPPTVVANASSTSICAGDPVTLTGSGAVSYNWDNLVLNGVPFTPASTTTYTVIGTDANGCTNTDQITITVNNCSLPVANFTASSTVICAGDVITFSDFSGSTTGITAWSWTFNGGLPATANTQGPHSVTFPTAGTFNITLQVTDANGVDDTTIVVTVNTCAAPIANFSMSVANGNICENSCIDFAYTGTGGTPTSFSWTFEGGTPPTSSIENPGTVCWNDTTGRFIVTLEVSNAFGTSTITDTVTVSQAPLLVVTPDTTIIIGNDVTLTAQATDTAGVLITGGTYAWSPSTDLTCVQCQTTTVIQPLVDGAYVVTYTASNGCVVRDTVNVTIDVQLNIGVPSAFTPNGDGINDFLFVRGELVIESLNFKIYNRYGQEVFSTTDKTKGWDGTDNGDELNSGVFVYFVNATMIDGSSQQLKGNVTLIK